MTNGPCERFNSTMCNMLENLPEKEKADWKSHLGSMTHAYNCTKHSSTTYSPYYLMFATQPRLPIDYEMGLPIDVLGDTCSKTRYVQKLEQGLILPTKELKRFPKSRLRNINCHMTRRLKGANCFSLANCLEPCFSKESSLEG